MQKISAQYNAEVDDGIKYTVSGLASFEAVLALVKKSTVNLAGGVALASAAVNVRDAIYQLGESGKISSTTLTSFASDITALSSLAVSGGLVASGFATAPLIAAGLAAASVSLGVYSLFVDKDSTVDVSGAIETVFDYVNNLGASLIDTIDDVVKYIDIFIGLGEPIYLAGGVYSSDIVDLVTPQQASIINSMMIDGLSLGLGELSTAVNELFGSVTSYIDPLVLDLDGKGFRTLPANGTVLFDHDADGVKEATGWIVPDDGLVAIDLNGNGVIDSGRELFGDSTILLNGDEAEHGFAALTEYDSTGDGVVDNRDEQFSHILVWRDLNSDGISQSAQQGTSGTGPWKGEG